MIKIKVMFAVLATALFLSGCATQQGKGTLEDPRIPFYSLMADGCYIAVTSGSNSWEAEGTHMGEYCPVYDMDGNPVVDASGRLKLKKIGGMSQIDDTVWADVTRSAIPGVATAATQGGFGLANQAMKNSGNKKVAEIQAEAVVEASRNRRGGDMSINIQGPTAQAGSVSSAVQDTWVEVEQSSGLSGVCTNLNGCDP